MENKNTKQVRSMVVVGLMAALVFIFTYIHIDIPTPLGKTMLHLGNVMCILSALLFGKNKGGLAAGIGSMFYDLFDPAYVATCWLTFIKKFAMAYVAGLVAHAAAKPGEGEPPERAKKKQALRNVLGAVCGAVTYVVLYLLENFIKNYYIFGYELETVTATLVTKGTTTLVNNAIAVVAALIMNAAIRPALEKSELANRLGVVE